MKKILVTSLAAALFVLPLAGCGEESTEASAAVTETSACWKMGNSRDEVAIAKVGEWPENPEKAACVAEIAAGENAYYGNK